MSTTGETKYIMQQQSQKANWASPMTSQIHINTQNTKR